MMLSITKGRENSSTEHEAADENTESTSVDIWDQWN